MGVVFHAESQNDSTLVECGYISFGCYRMEVADTIDKRFGLMYRGWYSKGAEWEVDDDGNGYMECVVFVPLPIESDEPRFLSRAEIDEWAEKLEGEYGDDDSPMSDFSVYRGKDGYYPKFKLSREKMQAWIDENITEAQGNLLFAPDCEGEWSWKECGELYDTFKDIDVKYVYRQSYDHDEDMHQMFLTSWKKCFDDKENMEWY